MLVEKIETKDWVESSPFLDGLAAEGEGELGIAPLCKVKPRNAVEEVGKKEREENLEEMEEVSSGGKEMEHDSLVKMITERGDMGEDHNGSMIVERSRTAFHSSAFSGREN